MCKKCPVCGAELIEALVPDHFDCPACNLYLSAWAAPFIETAVQPKPAEAANELSV